MKLNLETRLARVKVMQSFDPESIPTGGLHSQTVKGPPVGIDSGSKDCFNLPSQAAVSRLKELIRRIAINRQEDFPFPDDLETYLDDFVPNTLLKSDTLQQAFGVSGYEMEEVYYEAYRFYQEDVYLESSAAFRWLVLLNPFVDKYWKGLAASLQLLGKYEKALHAYAMAALLDSDNPYPHLYAYECYIDMHNSEDAGKALDLAYQRTLGKEAYRDLQKEIEAHRKRGGYLCLTESNP